MVVASRIYRNVNGVTWSRRNRKQNVLPFTAEINKWPQVLRYLAFFLNDCCKTMKNSLELSCHSIKHETILYKTAESDVSV